ncbi:hypothetical protein Oscil6304_1107 [Oscillatoria acuminata PCC 6304]|uniref:Uncharacterized protein n=2 Tax=Oscillatoria acuminata TaxID=118323 RepID=K9TFQ4_9CYAN|nr:hypothetical protein Oscil6304_1107 [Oscillatoria acuminata PCC 6304]
MPSQVWIIVEDEASAMGFPGADSEAIARMVEALQGAIAQTHPTCEVKVTSISHLKNLSAPDSEVLFCPLSLNIPDSVIGDLQPLYQACQDVEGLRTVVAERWQVAPGTGNLWLPVVLTTKGPIYGEAIGLADEKQPGREEMAQYIQPVHLPDRWRQPIYALGRRLLQWLEAPPTTYLIQFGWDEQGLWFDRLWPFPAIPALGSLGIQDPDLLTCHWYCLSGQPIYDLTIVPIQK